MSKVALAVLLLCSVQEEKKGPVDPKPRISMAIPLGVVPGTTSKITVRGLNLDNLTELKLSEPIEGATVTIKSKGKAEIPKETEPALYGDTKVDVEIKMPAEAPEKIALVAVNAAGQTAPHELPVLAKEKLVLEKEPNGGFATAQPVEAGQTVQGSVSQALDVDVFKIIGKKGETWVFEVEAQRRGSVLDAMLTLHDAASHLVASADDAQTSRDPVLRVTLPADGPYYVTLMDAHNGGGSSHVYLLRVTK
jgi:hypothetical protein